MKTFITLLLILMTAKSVQAQKIFMENNKYGIQDTEGKVIVSPQYDEIKETSLIEKKLFDNEGCWRVSLNGKWGFIIGNGKKLTEIKYDQIHHFSTGGLACIQLNKKWGFVDTTGKEIVSCKYDEHTSYSEGCYGVKLGDKWGFIDSTGKEIIPPKFEDPFQSVNSYEFNGGLSPVKVDGKLGFIDKTGKLVLPAIYTKVKYGFTEGNNEYAYVALGDELDSKYVYIDKSGNIVKKKIVDKANKLILENKK